MPSNTSSDNSDYSRDEGEDGKEFIAAQFNSDDESIWLQQCQSRRLKSVIL